VERLQVVFLDATTEVLIRRYESSRRRHPFDTEAGGSGSLATVIEAERCALEPVRMEADLVIDTSELSPPQLRSRLHDVFAGGGSETAMRTTVMSFGYKHGLPTDVDIVIDCRFLKNPHWVEDLRPLTGLDDPVRHFILEQPVAGPFVARLERLLALMLPQFVSEGKSYLTVAFGCTGGRHRSVAIAERFAEALDKLGHAPAVVHRDIDRG